VPTFYVRRNSKRVHFLFSMLK